MAEAKKDNNGVPTITGVLNTDGATPTRIKADASTHALEVADGTTGSDAGKDLAARDGNAIPVLLATDASNNIISLFVNSSGQLLIQST